MHHRTKSMFALFMSVLILIVGLNLTPVSAGTVYVWNKYNTVPQYTQGTWSAWSAGTTTTSSFSGSSTVTFNVSSGFVLSGSKTVSKTSPGSVYTGSATGITETNVTSTGVKKTRTCSRLNGTPIKGTYIAQVFSTISSTYPANNYSGSYWYVSAPSVQEVFPTVTVNSIANASVGATISVNATSTTPCYRMSAKYTVNGGSDNWLGDVYASSYAKTFPASVAGTYVVTVYARSYIETDPRSAASNSSKSFSVTVPQNTVTYNGNGNTSGSTPAPQNWTPGNSLTLATNTGNLAKTGYTFAGWNTLSSGNGTTYLAGQTVSLSASTTLYAKWVHTLSYSGYGSTSGSAPANQTWTDGNTLTLATNSGNLAKTGFTLASWNTKSDGSGIDYPLGKTGVSFTVDTTLYPRWTPNTNTVTYNGNGNTGGATPSPQQWMTGKSLALRKNGEGDNSTEMTKSGCQFAGWCKSQNGSGLIYQEMEVVDLGKEDCILYAVWYPFSIEFVNLKILYDDSYVTAYPNTLSHVQQDITFFEIPFYQKWIIDFNNDFANVSPMYTNSCGLQNNDCTDASCGGPCTNEIEIGSYQRHHKNGLKNCQLIVNTFPVYNSGYDLFMTLTATPLCMMNGSTHGTGLLGYAHSNNDYVYLTNRSTFTQILNVRIMQHEISHSFGCKDKTCLSSSEYCIMKGSYDREPLTTADIWCSIHENEFQRFAQ